MDCARGRWGSGRVAGDNATPGQVHVPRDAVRVVFYGPIGPGAWSVAWRRGSGDPPVIWAAFAAGGSYAPAELAIPPDATILEYQHSLGSAAFVAWS